MQGCLAFVAFSLCASSTYLLNDLMDLPSDRRHPHKRDRALASGRLPVVHALALIPAAVGGRRRGRRSCCPLRFSACSPSTTPDPVLFAAPQGHGHPGRARARRPPCAARHGRLGRRRHSAVRLADRVLRVPVLQPRHDQALRRTGGHAHHRRPPRPRPRLRARGQRAARGARRRQRLSGGAGARALHQRNDATILARPPPADLAGLRAAALLDQLHVADGASRAHARRSAGVRAARSREPCADRADGADLHACRA